MDNRVIIGAAVIIIIVAVAAIFLINPASIPGQPVQAAQTTKISMSNQGDSWIHAAFMIENGTSSNGTGVNINGKQVTLYGELYKQPQGQNLTMDISQQFNTGAFPPGTVLRMKMWAELLKNPVTTTDNLKFTLCGFNNQQPGSNDRPCVVVEQNIADVYQLPANLTSDSIKFTTDPVVGAGFLKSVRSYYMEFLITVNPDGSITITRVTTPELCQLAG